MGEPGVPPLNPSESIVLSVFDILCQQCPFGKLHMLVCWTRYEQLSELYVRGVDHLRLNKKMGRKSKMYFVSIILLFIIKPRFPPHKSWIYILKVYGVGSTAYKACVVQRRDISLGLVGKSVWREGGANIWAPLTVHYYIAVMFKTYSFMRAFNWSPMIPRGAKVLLLLR